MNISFKLKYKSTIKFDRSPKKKPQIPEANMLKPSMNFVNLLLADIQQIQCSFKDNNISETLQLLSTIVRLIRNTYIFTK